MLIFKILVSLVLGLLGVYYWVRGKKKQDIKMMLWGIALTLLSSYLPFAGGGDDDPTKALLKTMVPGTTEQQQQQQP